MLADAGLRGAAFCRALADLADRWLTGLLGDIDDVALVAVGGYGRRELCPASDLDVVLLHRGRRDVRQLAEKVWYPIWDAGVGLDHSVRTVKEAVRVASDDLKAALGMLDVRLVAGDREVADELTGKARDQWRKRARRGLASLAEAVAARHAEFGEVAFLLEPELKEGRGGLRDVHALRAADLATPVVDARVPALDAAYATLLDVRTELHRRTGKALDRLLLQEQDAVAAALGHSDADELMAEVAAAGRTIAWWSDDGWRRVSSALAGPRGRVAGRDRLVGAGLAVRDDELVLASDADLHDPSLVLRAAAAAADTGAPLGRSLLERLAGTTPPMGDPWPAAARNALVELLDAGHAAVAVLETLDQHGLLVQVLPEWEAVRSKPQRNAYHRFTVDRHLCEAAANAAALARRVSRPDLLLVGAWLHDIGKGFTDGPGGRRDHTDAGVEVVDRIARRMGFPPPDVSVLVEMVRHHLLLPDVATRRDLDDPATIDAVASAVGDRETLHLLAALTEADSLATGPAAWGPWKAGLVRDLVRKVESHLAGRRVEGAASLPTAEHRELMAHGRHAVDVAGNQLTVVAPDRPGLFSRVAGTLALHGLDVRSAVASGEDGMAVEVFEVDQAFDRPPDWPRVREDIERAVTGRLSLEARLRERVRAYASRRRAAAARPAEPVVLFDNDASATATVVEVRAPDGIGVLYRITRALADCDLDIRTAKVSTMGHEVVDAFYVTDFRGGKVVEGQHLKEIELSVLDALARPM